MVSNTCTDICDCVLEVMCHKCPHWETCQDLEDVANHDQMLECMGDLKMHKYPDTFISASDNQ
jgi:hypothetical protein